MAKKIEWTISNGKTAIVTVELQTSKMINADGDKITVDCCELHVEAEVEGMGYVGSGEPQIMTDGRAAARIGDLGLTAENLERVNAAIEEVKATPEWQTHVAAEAKGLAAERKVDRGRRAIERAMSGGTY